MPTRPVHPSAIAGKLEEALDFAAALGLLRRSADGHTIHAPFSLAPCPIETPVLRTLEALTAPFQQLALGVARSPEFLSEALTPAAEVDEFTAWLLELSRTAPPHAIELLISRSDYFIQDDGTGGAAIRQVELNTISASYPALAACTQRLHRALWGDTELGARLVANDPVPGLVEALSLGVEKYGHAQGQVLVVVQPGESNVYDQRLLEAGLRAHGHTTQRMTLEQVAAQSVLRQGRLWTEAESRPVAVVYYRAGYSPQDLGTQAAREGRLLIERSDAIQVPSSRMHLAGAKKVQQVLARPGVLRQFLDAGAAAQVQSSFARILAPEDPVDGAGGKAAWQQALAEPSGWVLKPQREGGGNNIYDDDIPRVLQGSSPRDRQAYILMERLRPLSRPAWLVKEGRLIEAQSVSEIGRFGVLLAENGRIALNRDVGYLVRTRPEALREGGVSAGFGYLDSLALAGS